MSVTSAAPSNNVRGIFDERTYQRPPEFANGCKVCSRPPRYTIKAGDPKLYCSRRCSHIARAARRAGSPMPVPEEGVCLVCGTTFPVESQPFCSRKHYWTWRRRKTASNNFHGHVRKAHWDDEWREWLAPKLGRSPDDPELPLLAAKLAVAGKVFIFIDKHGVLRAVGRPRGET